MTITALLALENDVKLVANLSDGRELRETDTEVLASKLFALGLTADDVQTQDWRESDAALSRGQIIAIKFWMRKRLMQEQHRAK